MADSRIMSRRRPCPGLLPQRIIIDLLHRSLYDPVMENTRSVYDQWSRIMRGRKRDKTCIVLVTQGGQGLLVHNSLMSMGLAEEATCVRPEKKRTKPDKGQPSNAGSPAGLALGLEASSATSLAGNG